LVTPTGVPKVNVLEPVAGLLIGVADPSTDVGAVPELAKIEHFMLPV
jgi:hypothetical protein